MDAETIASRPEKAVVVHAGSRDGYQVAYALAEQGLLARLVTNVYSELVARRRYGVSFLKGDVCISPRACLAYACMRAIRRWDLHEFSNAALGKKAQQVAFHLKAPLVAYSYYARGAFACGRKQARHRILFQVHPHPKPVRALLREEIDRVPLARCSLEVETELRLRGADFDKFAGEAALATAWIVASSYTASTLAASGIPRSRIHVIPYGVNPEIYPERKRSPDLAKPFTVIFVGSLIQRKGLYDLLDAVRRLKTKQIRVVLRGRGYVDKNILSHFSGLDLDIRHGAPTQDLVRDLHNADVFVLPSIAEGFGHSILEAMSCGLPVITTPNTCAPDILTPGRHGAIVPIRDSEALAAAIDNALVRRKDLPEMGRAAAVRARELTWKLFRERIRDAYGACLVQ